MKMSRGLQRGIVFAFFVGVLTAIFLPVAIVDNPINNNNNIAIPATESINIGPAIKLVEEEVTHEQLKN